MTKLPVIRIESLTDSQGKVLLVTVAGCYLDNNDKMMDYNLESITDLEAGDSCVDALQEAERRVSWLRKQGFEFQLVRYSSSI